MKYGLLVNETNCNLGDDIQAYAEAQFLPRIDVLVNREQLDVFKYKDGKDPVALIMGAWFMWRKYNWPPARQIVPLLVGYHHYNRRTDPLINKYAIPIFEQNYDGIGGQWFKDFGPVGCRDENTCEILTNKGIPNYFSGCVTLTLPKQPKTEDAGEYVVFVDLNKKVEQKVRKMIGKKYKCKVLTHTTKNIEGATWEERKKRVEEYLTVYQNAKYVVTRRLHVALPCLAMGVPVMMILPYEMNDPNRFKPYSNWLHFCRNNDFLKNGYPDFDFINGTTKNKPTYKKYRDSITKSMKDFINYCEKNKEKPISFFDKRTFTLEEENAWRVSFMRATLERTHKESKQMHQQIIKIRKESISHTVARKIYEKKIKNTKLENSKLIKKIKNKVK